MAKKELVLQIDRGVKGKDFTTNAQFVYDQLFVEVNGFHIKVKAKDETSRDMIDQALKNGERLVLQYEDITAQDEDGKDFTYQQIFTICDGDELLIKAKDVTGRKKIVKFLQNNAQPSV